MDINKLTQISELIDTEIILYDELKDLYKQKKEILISNKADSLVEVDASIIEKTEQIRNANTQRSTIAGDFQTISSLIEIAADADKGLLNRLEEQKLVLKQLADDIGKLEKVNYELLKQNMKITLKMLSQFMGSDYKQTNDYDRTGKVKTTSEISSIEKNI